VARSIDARRRALNGLLVACALLGLAPGALAQAPAWPSKPIQLLSGFGPGSNPDTIARFIGPALTERIGQPIVVDSKASAAGRIATTYMAKQPGGGHNWIMITGGDGVLAALIRDLPYDLLRDFAFVSTVAEFPFLLVTHPDSPYRTLPDLIEAARSRPGKLNYGSTGVGSTLHLAGELLKATAGIDMQHVPFKTTAVPDLAAGRLDMAVTTPTSGDALIKSGKVRPIAVTSPKRSPHYPDVATVAETLAGYEVVSWLGLAVPSATHPAIVERLSNEIRAVLAREDIRSRMANVGVDASAMTPAELRARVESDIRKWRGLGDRVKLGE
jgi:tripartite-type tricarboxylate transporter receptor subunit TctC